MNKESIKKILYFVNILFGILIITSYISAIFFSDAEFLDKYSLIFIILYFLSALFTFLIYRKTLKPNHKKYFLIISLLFTLFFGSWILIFGLIFLGQYLQEIFG